MLETDSLTTQKLIAIATTAYMTRYADEKMAKLVRQNKGGNFHLSANGHELAGAVASLFLRPGIDWALPYYRDRAVVIGLGSPLVDIIGSFLARDAQHHSGGRMMPDHYADTDRRIPCQSSCVGAQFLQACGIALAAKHRASDEIVYVSCGDGATSQGDFHEALNFASLQKLPILFVVQDNGWAISVPVQEQTATSCSSTLPPGYGIAVEVADGTDVEAVYHAFAKGVSQIREYQKPFVVVVKVPRLSPHSSSDDDSKYKTVEQKQQELAKDPITRLENTLIEYGISFEELKKEVQNRVEKAIEAAEALPHPSAKQLFDPFPIPSRAIPPKSSEEEMVIVDAIHKAIVDLMEFDSNVILFGEDVAGNKGGVFGVSHGLEETFGSKRVFNTPLAESTILGVTTGYGMAPSAFPIAEIQFCDYMWTGANHLLNILPSIAFRSKGQWRCHALIRMPSGGYIQGGPYHSQNIESYLLHTPGLTVIYPSTSEDAYGLILSAYAHKGPTVCLEHKALYRMRKYCAGKVGSAVPLGKGKIIYSGTDLTIVTYGMMSLVAFEVAKELSTEGIFVEVIDLRTVVPFDKELIENSVKKTGKILTVHEASVVGGVGAEICAWVSETLFSYLDAPPRRIGALHCPVAFSKELEKEILPSKESILAAAKALADF